jgi:hypothetical protein
MIILSNSITSILPSSSPESHCKYPRPAEELLQTKLHDDEHLRALQHVLYPNPLSSVGWRCSISIPVRHAKWRRSSYMCRFVAAVSTRCIHKPPPIHWFATGRHHDELRQRLLRDPSTTPCHRGGALLPTCCALLLPTFILICHRHCS